MLTRGEAFVDPGQQRYEEISTNAALLPLNARAAALVFQIHPVDVAA